MKCDICKKNEASIHIQEVINNNIKTLHICEECSKAYGFKNGILNIGYNLMDFFEKFDPFKINEDSKEPIKKDKIKKIAIEDESIIKCLECGTSYDEFLEKGKFGCSFCYTAFKDQIKPVIRRIHGKITHKGKVPEKYKQTIKIMNHLKILNNRMKIAVKKENFEKAAQIRDEIQKVMKEMEKNNARVQT